MVPTPIGNLDDMSLRARNILQQVNVIAAEDTRRTGQLLQHFSISVPMVPYHEHNEHTQRHYLLTRLQQGESVAVVSDAGTPLISDPGYQLVRDARKLQVSVVALPGPCAAITALSGAGLPTDQFKFIGFPPHKGSARRRWYEGVSSETATLVCYEAPHRIESSLQDAAMAFGATRSVVIARELTKTFETWLVGTIANVIERVAADPNQRKGEFVLIFAGAPEQVVDNAEIKRVMALLISEVKLKTAAALAAELLNVGKNHCYEIGLELKNK